MGKRSLLFAPIISCTVVLCGISSAQWKPISWTQPTWYVLASDSVLYACTQSVGIFASTDEPQTWTGLNNGLDLQSKNVRTLSKNSFFLFAGTNEGVFRSGDGGLRWTFSHSGLGSGLVTSILAQDTLVLAGTYASGVFASYDNATHWDSASSGIGGSALYVNALVGVGGLVFAGTRNGVYRSENNGLTWSRTSQGIQDSVILQLMARDTVLFAGAGG